MIVVSSMLHLQYSSDLLPAIELAPEQPIDADGEAPIAGSANGAPLSFARAISYHGNLTPLPL
jgi:hypothetical protein